MRTAIFFSRHLLTSCCAVFAICASTDTLAAQFVVTKTTDSFDGTCNSDCSLREAVHAANQMPGEHNIKLEPLTYVYSIPAPRDEEGITFEEDDISIGDIEVRQSITITGSKTGSTVINANFKDRHFSVTNNATLSLSNVALTGGRCSTFGGAILNRGSLYLQQVVMDRNFASAWMGGGGGGAIANFNEMEIRRSSFSRNVASFGDSGSAMGGAIFNSGKAYIRDSAFRQNRATTDDVTSQGGAIYNDGIADIGRSIFIKNAAAGGGMALYNRGQMSVSNATVSDSTGEDIYYFGAVQNTTSGTLTLIHTSILGSIFGSGLLNYGAVSIRNSIIIDNKYSSEFSTEYEDYKNCVNYAPSSLFKTKGLLLGNGNTKCTGEIHADDSTAYSEIVAPLAQNNYELESYALLPNSPAIDAAVGSCSLHDQRWLPRPIDGNADGIAACDLGPIEMQMAE